MFIIFWLICLDCFAGLGCLKNMLFNGVKILGFWFELFFMFIYFYFY